MFRIGLLTSTAMTAITLLLPGAPIGAYAQTDMHVANRDANARFLCTYGQFDVFLDYGGQSSFFSSGWERVAVPVHGHGQTVRQIIVMEAKNRFVSGNASFSVGIYSNKNGLPGKLIAGSTASASLTCGPVTVNIAPTTLQPNRKYWIEERAQGRGDPSSSYVAFSWAVNPKTKRRAYVQKHTFSSSSGVVRHHSTTPWTQQPSGPWFKLK